MQIFIYRFADSFQILFGFAGERVQILVHRAADSFQILFCLTREGVQVFIHGFADISQILRCFRRKTLQTRLKPAELIGQTAHFVSKALVHRGKLIALRFPAFAQVLRHERAERSNGCGWVNLLRKLRLFRLAGQQNDDQSQQDYHQNQGYNGYVLHNFSFYSTFSSFAMRCIS